MTVMTLTTTVTVVNVVTVAMHRHASLHNTVWDTDATPHLDVHLCGCVVVLDLL
jgi:hypothetical protein